MSGPKCEEITLSKNERKRIRQEQEERLRRERERIREEKEKERREQERIRKEQERREQERQQEEKRRKREAANAYNRAVETQLKAYEAEQEKVAKAERKAFDEAVADYEAAASLAGVIPKRYDFPSKDVKKLTEKILEESRKLEKQALDAAYSQKVDDWIDRTVEEMGYHLIGQRQTEGQQYAVEKLYRYDEDTALHVIGVDGQFTMEVVALDNISREPDSEEQERLMGSMERFCEDYQIIQSKLEQTQALEIKQIFHLPPDKKYASVVNQTRYRKADKPRMSHGADYMASTDSTAKGQQSLSKQ